MLLWKSTPGFCETPPQLTYYKAPIRKTNASVIIFPGGGYVMKADYEGQGYAEYLNSIGIDAFVLDYRVDPHHFPLELLDARRSVRYVRAHAAEYELDPDKIAVMGSSAGGHLAALLCSYSKGIDYEKTDEIDHQNYLPNAQILCYPVICSPDSENISHEGSFIHLLGEKNMAMAPEVSPEKDVNADTPQAFIWHTSDDATVNVINSYRYATALRKNNIPVEMHIFPNGRHGAGLATDLPHVAQWSSLLEKWLQYIQWL